MLVGWGEATADTVEGTGGWGGWTWGAVGEWVAVVLEVWTDRWTDRCVNRGMDGRGWGAGWEWHRGGRG